MVVEGMRRATFIFSLLFLLLLLSACEQNQLIDENVTPVQPPGENRTIRPDIPKGDPSDIEHLYPEPAHRYPAELRQFLNVQSKSRYAEDGVIVGSYEEPFLIGMTIGELVPMLARGSIDMLTTRMPTWQGRTLEAESYLRFDFDENSTGELRYEVDPDTDEREAYLFFEEEKPMFEYAYLLHEGAFPAMVGEVIDFFGDDYIIHEASNESITLYGKEKEEYLYLVNGSGLSINGDTISDTKVRVDPWSVMITYYTPTADDGIKVAPGEGLRQHLKRPERLLHPLFDIRFDGFEENVEDTVLFKQKSKGVEMTFTNVLGEEAKFMLLSADPTNESNETTLHWGEEGHALFFKECDSGKYCINIDDRFALLTKAGVSRILELRTVSTTFLRLIDLATGEEHRVKLVDTGDKEGNNSILKGMMDFGAGFHTVRVLMDKERPRICVDLDGDGGIGGDEVSLFTPFSEIEMTDDHGVILRQPETPSVDEEEILVSFTDDFLMSSNVTLGQIENEDTWEGVTQRGAIVRLEETTDGIQGERLLVSFPPEFRPGLVRIIG